MSRGKAPRLLPTQKAVRELRKHRQWTQAQLAEHIGVALNTVSRWESTRPPRAFSLVQLRDAALEFGRSDLAAIFGRPLRGDIEQVAAQYPPPNPAKPLEDALRHLMTANWSLVMPPPLRVRKAYGKVISAITEAHAELINEAKRRGYERPELTETQDLLERIDDFEGER
jgi:transcriptional regulator with XRE-family HTH domain